MTFIPRTPYFPPGSLRDVLCYPLGTADFRRCRSFDCGSTRIGLGRLAPMLDHVARWDRELNDEEQRLLAFARLALHKPRWVVIDEALDTLGGDARKRVFSVLRARTLPARRSSISAWPSATAISSRRVVHLAADPKGHALKPMRQSSVAMDRLPAAAGA